jgi:hypothetical protein
MKLTVQINGGLNLGVQVDEGMSLKLERDDRLICEDDQVALCIAQVMSSEMDV